MSQFYAEGQFFPRLKGGEFATKPVLGLLFAPPTPNGLKELGPFIIYMARYSHPLTGDPVFKWRVNHQGEGFSLPVEELCPFQTKTAALLLIGEKYEQILGIIEGFDQQRQEGLRKN